MFLDFPVFARAGIWFESYLGHTLSPKPGAVFGVFGVCTLYTRCVGVLGPDSVGVFSCGWPFLCRGFLSVGLIDVLAFHCFMVLTGRSNMTWFARGRGAAADCVFLFASTLQKELRAVLHSSLRLRR
jgi:hypothetical protein